MLNMQGNIKFAHDQLQSRIKKLLESLPSEEADEQVSPPPPLQRASPIPTTN
mgnify:CR=1 FL=1